MKISIEKLAALVAGLVVLLAIAWAVFKPDPMTEEDRIRHAIQEVAEGAREADIDRTFKPISKEYKHEEFDRQQLKAYVFSQFQKRGAVTVVLSDIDVRINPADQAVAHFNAGLAQGVDVTQFDLLPEQADRYAFEVRLRAEDGEWKIVEHIHESKTGSNDRIDF